MATTRVPAMPASLDKGEWQRHCGGLVAGKPPKVEGRTEKLRVPLPFSECVEHYQTALKSDGGTIASSVESGAATHAALGEGRLVVARAVEKGPRTTEVDLFELTYPVEAEIATAAPATFAAAPTTPIVVVPGSVVSTSGQSTSETEDGVVTGEVEVGATVAREPAAVRAHFEGWLTRERYERRSVVTSGGVMAVLGLRPDRLVFAVIAGKTSSAYVVIYAGPVERPPDMPRLGQKRHGPHVQVQPGFTVGEPLPEGFPLLLIGGSNVEKAERTEAAGGRHRYRVTAQVAFGIETSMGKVNIDPYEYYKGQLEKLGLKVKRRGKKLIGKGEKGKCKVVPGAKQRVVIDCTLAP